MIRRKRLLLLVLFQCLAIAVFASAETFKMPFGKKGYIDYDPKTGTANIYVNNTAVFKNAYAEVNIEGKLISSKDYQTTTLTKGAVSNGFGKGVQYTVKLSGNNLPEMDLIWYTYTSLDYFFTEVQVKGQDLKTNYMAPFCSSFKAPAGDVRTLFVPFDNDTFISYNAKPFTRNVENISAEAGTVYDNNSRQGFVAGSVEHEVWKTGVLTSQNANVNTLKVWGGYTAKDVTRDNITHGSISGNTVKSPLIFVGYFDDWRTGFEEYGKANRIAEPPYIFNWAKATPVGWNSWGVMQEKLTYNKAVKVVDFFADSLKQFREDHTAFIDLDSYWDNMLRGGIKGDLSKLKDFVNYCRSKGLETGVYWAPFTDWGWHGGPDRIAEGGNYKFGDMWTKVSGGYHDIDGARALDPTHPGTRQRIAFFIKKLKECGFKMIKIDFLGHATAESTHFYDPAVTTGMQAYRKGMEYLIDQLGDQMLVYAAISPNLATGRYVHMRRIACDAFKSIHDTRYTLNSVTYGWWQTYLYNYVDADHVVLSNQSDGENRARLLSAVVTGTLMTGDDFSEKGPWAKKAMQWYQNKELLEVVKNGKAFEPIDGNTGDGASNMFSRQIGGYYYLAVFNYNSQPQSFKINAQRIGLSSAKKYEGHDILSGQTVKLNGNTEVQLAQMNAVLYKFKL